MGLGDKFDEMKGAAKEKFGDATDDRSTQAKGAAEKHAARAKQDVKEGVDNLKEGAQERFGDDKPRNV
ncbi:CsbD family protein [Georgenia sp. Z1491]|uniref:CsbD family protein n=1 Tax=Georgenia sp. Z1491 TaxID=3416707 RepID=UPI003CFBBF98